MVARAGAGVGRSIVAGQRQLDELLQPVLPPGFEQGPPVGQQRGFGRVRGHRGVPSSYCALLEALSRASSLASGNLPSMKAGCRWCDNGMETAGCPVSGAVAAQ